MVRFITDDASIDVAKTRYLKRRKWLMNQCNGPIVLSSPTVGPNQTYPWAHCDAPVYQDSYLLYLTGINQYPLHVVLNPLTEQHHIFLPPYNAKHVFWEGHTIAANHSESELFLKECGFTHIHDISKFRSFIGDLISKNPNWHLLIHEHKRKRINDESYRLIRSLKRRSLKPPLITNIADLSWQQRAQHDQLSLATLKTGIEKTAAAYNQVLLNRKTFTSETSLCGALKGALLSQTPFGLSFSPIVARNQNAAILHYVDCCDAVSKNDLILLDFGLRWQSMCTDISRTITLSGKLTPLQKMLVDIVKNVQEHVISLVKPGTTFDALNDACWNYMELLLERDFLAKGGTFKRDYSKQPHNVGHLLGIQTHDGDPFRTYRSNALKPGAVITIEPGLYGQFEYNGDRIHCGIRIEDNILVTPSGCENLSINIPK